MKQVITLRVNGTEYTLAAEPNATLADVLREELRFTGVKKGCDDGECGACSVLLDKCKVIPSCTTLACEVQGHDITTVEGLKQGDQLHPVQQAFVDCFAVQCGFCTPGMIMSAKALLLKNPHPNRDEIKRALAGNVCRCTGYIPIVNAVSEAAERLGGNGR